jgi:hypothetical protein
MMAVIAGGIAEADAAIASALAAKPACMLE